MPTEFSFLADHPEAVPTVADWYFRQWGHLTAGNSKELVREHVEGYMNREQIPLMVVATKNHEFIAAAQLKYREMEEMFPDLEHWLGGVYVASGYRGRGIGSQVVRRIISLARTLGVETLYLQTEALDGGLYARLGWKPVTNANNHGTEVLVMALELAG